jgi:hypothetical protein
METKVCRKCKEEKDVSDFYKNSHSKDGLRSNCKICQNKNSTNWRTSNVEKYNEIQKKFKTRNPNATNISSLKWKNKNKDRCREKSNLYKKNKYKNDINYRLEKNLRNRLNEFFFNRGYTKKNRFIEFLGCDIEFLKNYLESKFQPSMTWENKGFYGWHIDHIIPLSSAKTDEELYKLCHYSNLQPLWANENLSKGSKIL